MAAGTDRKQRLDAALAAVRAVDPETLTFLTLEEIVETVAMIAEAELGEPLPRDLLWEALAPRLKKLAS